MLNKIRIDKKFWINLVCFLLGGILLVYLIEKYRVAPDIKFTEMKLMDTNSKTVNLSDYKGKVIFLNFWETWCGPCVQELPTIEKAREQIDSTKMVFITVAEESPAKISDFKFNHDYRFNYFISEAPFSELGINTYPTTYIIDREGKIALTRIGGVDWSAPEIINMMKDLAK
jgi:thiol-disulfide isomerase/thioredoxin